MMYVVQIAVVVFITWASIHYEWDAHGPAIAFVAIMAAAIVTGIIYELKLLPSRLARLCDRIFGLKDEPGDEIASLGAAFRHPRNTFEDRGRSRIGEDPRQFVKVTSELPLTVLVTNDGPPLTRTESGFDGLTDDTSTGHGPKLLGIERGE